MIKGNDFNLQYLKAAKRVQKKAIPVKVMFALVDGDCETKEGVVSFKAGDALLTGIEGEQWPIERSKFDASYIPLAPTCQGKDGQYTKKPISVYALQINQPFYVTVSWAENRLEGKAGDWLLQYEKNDYGIVDKSIFEKTYDILGNINGLKSV